MSSLARKSASVTARWISLLALTVTMTGFLQILNLRPAAADTGNYPWWNAPCAWTGSTTGSCSGYDWGESTCPSGDGYCTSGNEINGYYQLDNWGYGFRNCTSYAAWKINNVFNVSNITGWGNAATWYEGYTSPQTYTVYSPSSYTPQKGDIAQWDSEVAGGYGHVAYVYYVNSSGIASLYDYNQDTLGDFSYSNTTASSSEGTPDHYIHIGNITTPPPSTPTHRDLAWYDGTNLYGFQAYGYGTSATVSGYSQPYWAGAGQLSTASSEGLFWYLNNGSGGTTGTIYWIPGGNFANATAIRSGIGLPVWAGVGNFTGDGKRDSIAWYDGTTLWLFTGSGLGTTWSTTGYSAPAWAGVGDYNKDGKDDLFWYLSSSTTIYVLTSTGSGFNGAASVRGPGVGAPVWAGVGDFHGDGYRDALAWYDGSTLFTFEGSGLATTGSVSGYSTPTWAGVGQWDSTTTKDGLFWYLGSNVGGNGTIYGIDSNGTSFYGAANLRGPGVGSPTRADTGNFY
jgi:surface antigen